MRCASAGSIENEKRCNSITASIFASKIAYASARLCAFIPRHDIERRTKYRPAHTQSRFAPCPPCAGRGKCVCRLETPGNRKRWAPVEDRWCRESCESRKFKSDEQRQTFQKAKQSINGDARKSFRIYNDHLAFLVALPRRGSTAPDAQ